MFRSPFVLVVWLLLTALAKNTKLREFIVKIYKRTDSADVFFIGTDEDFLSDFVKTEVDIPISFFDDSFSGNFRQCNNAFIVFLVPENNHAYWKMLNNLIHSLLVRKFVLISASTFNSLNEYFYFFAERNFTRIFGMLSNSSSYAFLPFADNQVQELSEEDNLPDALKDLNGFVVRTTIQFESPRSFWYPSSNGQESIGGRFGQIFLQFLRRHNATFKEICIGNSRNPNIEAMVNATINQEIDISTNPYFQQKNLDFSYPVTLNKLVIMVPYNGLLSPNQYFWRPFTAGVWLCICLSVILMIIVKITLDSLSSSRVDVWSSFCVIYLMLLNLPAPTPSSNYRFYCFVLLFAFIIGIFYDTYFQSFLTVFIKIKQFDTIKDLAKNNILVMVSSFRWNIIQNNSFPEELRKIIRPTPHLEFVTQMNSMRNTSYAFISEEDRCQFFIAFHSFYEKCLFRIAREYLKVDYTGYLLPFHSPFKEILNNFIIEIKQTGLTKKWDSDIIFQTSAAGFRMRKDKNNKTGFGNIKLTVHTLQFAWISLTIGLSISTLIFIGEFLWFYRQRTAGK
ncbi:uncharacterized protein LOC129944102 [Eupeodes corollae]|uniref:uncharacterized protein LOC129944102 n=1 Tax=Eupeodes corollae TaxID=290404 RepID=UPI00249237B1|nr:uncharacterized protein LOC129944102 [Eupeodes corollae]